MAVGPHITVTTNPASHEVGPDISVLPGPSKAVITTMPIKLVSVTSLPHHFDTRLSVYEASMQVHVMSSITMDCGATFGVLHEVAAPDGNCAGHLVVDRVFELNSVQPNVW